MIFIIIPLILLCVWLAVIVPPLHRRPLGRLGQFHYAHRGLWNDKLPENSLPAFEAAVNGGYGIELDVHLTADNRIVVFHDDTLARMCSDDRRVESLTLDELRKCRLNGTCHGIPTLNEVLGTVQGRVPLLIEIKPGKRLDELCRLVYEEMRTYGHPDMWMIESFHPLAVKWFRRNAPGVIRGQLAFGLRTHSPKKPLNLFVASLLSNALSRPDFIAYCAEDEPSLPMRWVRLFRPHFVAWTVRSAQQSDAILGKFHLQIFEGFRPKH